MRKFAKFTYITKNAAIKKALWRVPQGWDEKLYIKGLMLGLWLH